MKSEVNPDVLALAHELSFNQDAKLLPQAAANMMLEAVASLHVVDPALVHWWEGLRNISEYFNYENDLDAGLKRLSGYLDNFKNEKAYLVVTDDESSPWPVLLVGKDRIQTMLRELPFFEYFVCTLDYSTIIFDTHQNTLVTSSVAFPVK